MPSLSRVPAWPNTLNSPNGEAPTESNARLLTSRPALPVLAPLTFTANRDELATKVTIPLLVFVPVRSRWMGGLPVGASLVPAILVPDPIVTPLRLRPGELDIDPSSWMVMPSKVVFVTVGEPVLIWRVSPGTGVPAGV